MIEFVIEKVANMVFISSGEHIWRAWDETEVTERKINNAINRISKEHCGNIKVINRL